MPDSIVLKAVRGPLEGQTFEFGEHDMFIFGRAVDCHAQLPFSDGKVSRHHFIIEVNPPDACIRDLGSLNGTFVNEVKYGGRDPAESPEDGAARTSLEVDLKEGDRIRVGKTEFLFEVRLTEKCCKCGRDIAETEKEDCKRMGEAFLCQDCEQRQVTGPVLPPGEIPQPKQEDSADPHGIPGYEIGRMLGKGGMGEVYLVKRKTDQAELALKIMHPKAAVNMQLRDMFEREIQNMCSFSHDNIVALYDHGLIGTAFYCVMEFCPGGNLMDLMERRSGKLSLDEVGPLALQALEGLHYINSQGYVHRDLKPENILLSARTGGVAKVGDFGFTKNFENAGFSGMTKTGQAAGTFPYMPREQLVNYKYVKPVTDVWSMGATLYFVLTAQLPRDFQHGQSPMEAVLHQPVIPIRKRDSSIPKSVAKVIDHSLKDKDKRYQTAEEFRLALVKAL
jgi:hypothetical protein